MGKKGLALASLVMAIPAGVGFWFSLRAALDYGENMPVVGTVIIWSLVVLCLLLAVSPIFFLILGPKSVSAPAPQAVAVATPPKKSPDNLEELDGDEGEDGEPLFEDEAAAADGDFEDNFDFDDAEADEEQPKKKKKK